MSKKDLGIKELENGWLEVPFSYMVENISQRIEPSQSDLDIFIGLEHLDPLSLKINRWGSPKELKGTKLLAQPGDIIFGKRNAYLRKAAVCEVNAVVSAHAMILRPREENVLKEFIYFFMQTDEFYKRSMMISEGSISPTIKWKVLSEEKFIIPNKKKQIDILMELNCIENLILAKKYLFEKLLVYREKLLSTILDRGLYNERLKNTKIGNIPETWNIYTLNELIEKDIIIDHLDGNHGGLYPKSNEFTESGIPYVSANCIDRNKIDFNKVKYLTETKASCMKKGIAKNNDVLFAHNATVGPVALLETEFDYVILGTSLTYYRVNDNYLNNKFLMYYMQSKKFKKQYEKTMTQTTRSQVPITKQRTFRFVLPKLEEQNKIVQIISNADLNIENIEEEIKNLKDLKLHLVNRLTYKI